MPRIMPLPAETDPLRRILSRDDVRLTDGVLHLVGDDTAPAEARDADLRFVADALDAAGIEMLLVRDTNRRPKIVVDLTDAAAALAALRRAAADEPLYVKSAGEDATPVHTATVADDTVSAMAVFRPRTSVDGAFRYGSGFAPQLEFWRFGDELVEAPRPNALTRRVMAVGDLAFVEVERHGRQWRTIEGMFEPHANEFTGDVDMVFSWVDGTDSEFQRQRAARMQGYVVGDGDDAPARYRQIDELRYALRSVHMFAPWVRRIFIVTDSPRPAWLAEHPGVTIVRSEEFFADPSTLPTHNSHAVEAQLHRIEGLAEHFLYSNDDMFFGRPVAPELFFSGSGVSRFIESGVRIGAGDPATSRSGHDNALRRNRALLRERFGRVITHDLEHSAVPMRRSIAAELEQTFAADYARTAGNRFRSATDVSVTNSLYHYYSLFTGRAVVTTEPRVRYIQTTKLDSLRRMERLLERRDTDMFCLNDGSEPEIPEEMRVKALRSCLERYFPVRAPWERVESVSSELSGSPASEPSAASIG